MIRPLVATLSAAALAVSAFAAAPAGFLFATFKGEHIISWNEIMAASALTALPIVAIYLFLERYLVSGLTAGSVK